MKNGPIYKYDCKYWYKDNSLHREYGPAVEYPDGHKEWWINNHLHREDGPAIEYANGDKVWYINGKLIVASCNEEFLRLVKLKALW